MFSRFWNLSHVFGFLPQVRVDRVIARSASVQKFKKMTASVSRLNLENAAQIGMSHQHTFYLSGKLIDGSVRLPFP